MQCAHIRSKGEWVPRIAVETLVILDDLIPEVHGPAALECEWAALEQQL